MKTCLMIGNGLNRCIDVESCDKLLNTFAKRRSIKRGSSSIPFPLEFERLMNVHLAQSSIKRRAEAYSSAKGAIAKEMQELSLPSDAIHYNLCSLHVDYIITTNYDFLLEKALSIPDPTMYCRNKRAYISSCTSEIDKLQFFHPHGVISNPSTICLGYMDYAKIIKDLQKTIAHQQKNRKDDMLILQHCRKGVPENHWATKLYDSNVAFVGFGLDTCEMDFWWALAHRASLVNLQVSDAATTINNTIVYYDIITPAVLPRMESDDLTAYIRKQISNDKANEDKLQKHKLLESMNVFVKTVSISSLEKAEYVRAYKLILKDIRDNGIIADKHVIG